MGLLHDLIWKYGTEESGGGGGDFETIKITVKTYIFSDPNDPSTAQLSPVTFGMAAPYADVTNNNLEVITTPDSGIMEIELIKYASNFVYVEGALGILPTNVPVIGSVDIETLGLSAATVVNNSILSIGFAQND